MPLPVADSSADGTKPIAGPVAGHGSSVQDIGGGVGVVVCIDI